MNVVRTVQYSTVRSPSSLESRSQLDIDCTYGTYRTNFMFAASSVKFHLPLLRKIRPSKNYSETSSVRHYGTHYGIITKIDQHNKI